LTEIYYLLCQNYHSVHIAIRITVGDENVMT